jgi:hypothetical protein
MTSSVGRRRYWGASAHMVGVFQPPGESLELDTVVNNPERYGHGVVASSDMVGDVGDLALTVDSDTLESSSNLRVAIDTVVVLHNLHQGVDLRASNERYGRVAEDTPIEAHALWALGVGHVVDWLHRFTFASRGNTSAVVSYDKDTQPSPDLAVYLDTNAGLALGGTLHPSVDTAPTRPNLWLQGPHRYTGSGKEHIFGKGLGNKAATFRLLGAATGDAYELLADRLRAFDVPDRAAFATTEEWVGRVQEVHDDYFGALLRNARKPHDERYVELVASEIPRAEREYIRVGAVFYWSLGYHVAPDGHEISAASIRFRRPTTFSAERIEAARRRGAERRRRLAEVFGSNRPNPD